MDVRHLRLTQNTKPLPDRLDPQSRLSSITGRSIGEGEVQYVYPRSRIVTWRLGTMEGDTAFIVQSSNQSEGFSWYDLWYPVPTDRFGAARASPSFVAYLLITEAVGSSGRSQLSLINIPSAPQLAAYAIWDPAIRQSGIARLVLLNLSTKNTTATNEEIEETEVTVDLSSLIRSRGGEAATVKRMTSPGLDSKDVSQVLWAGQSFENGTASGTEAVEKVVNGTVTVGGSEGVLVFFN